MRGWPTQFLSLPFKLYIDTLSDIIALTRSMNTRRTHYIHAHAKRSVISPAQLKVAILYHSLYYKFPFDGHLDFTLTDNNSVSILMDLCQVWQFTKS